MPHVHSNFSGKFSNFSFDLPHAPLTHHARMNACIHAGKWPISSMMTHKHQEWWDDDDENVYAYSFKNFSSSSMKPTTLNLCTSNECILCSKIMFGISSYLQKFITSSKWMIAIQHVSKLIIYARVVSFSYIIRTYMEHQVLHCERAWNS